MLSEFLQTLKKMIESDRLAQSYQSPTSVIYVNKMTGETYTVEKPRTPFDVVTLSVESFLAAAEMYGVSTATSLYVAPDKLVAVLNDGSDHRRDRVTLPLSVNPAVESLSGYSRFSPRDFVEFLRIHLCGTQVDPADLRQRVQVVKFASSQERQNAVKHGDEAVSSSIVSKMTGAGDIPESFRVAFPFYPSLVDEIDTSVQVELAIMLDMEQGEFVVRELPGQMDAARVHAVKVLQRHLAMFSPHNVIVGECK